MMATRSWAMLLAVACLATSGTGRAATPPPKRRALVIGVDDAGTAAGAEGCLTTAMAVRDRLITNGFSVAFADDPGPVAFRAALDNFAGDESAADRVTSPPLIYVCAPASISDARLFVLAKIPSPGDIAPKTDGIVALALLNVLIGTGGTLFADLALTATQSGEMMAALRGRVPSGAHMALATSGRGRPIGEALAAGVLGADSDWSVQITALSARQPGLMFEPRPAPAASAPPKQDVARAMAPPAPTVPSPDVPPPGVGKLAPLPLVVVSARPVPLRLPPATIHASEPLPGNRRVARLQAALVRKGFYHGPVDGDLDGETLLAIRTFQQSLGDPPSGTLNSREIVRLLNPS